MSYDLRNENRGDNGINRTATEGERANSNDGFEGMNYEQVRQPYNPRNRNSEPDERGVIKRPDEE